MRQRFRIESNFEMTKTRALWTGSRYLAAIILAGLTVVAVAGTFWLALLLILATNWLSGAVFLGVALGIGGLASWALTWLLKRRP